MYVVCMVVHMRVCVRVLVCTWRSEGNLRYMSSPSISTSLGLELQAHASIVDFFF